MPTSPRHIPFVGRVQEMAELKVALDDALVGRGGLVMLAGEPGIGKTRLTEELMAIAKDRGALVAPGACYEGGSVPPYWPWTQAIRSLLIEPPEATLTALEARAAVIAEIVPEIRETLPNQQPAPEADPAMARFRLFESVTSFLNKVAAAQPLLLVLDDLHWADRSTLDLLEFVAREISLHPMLLVGGYRDMELARRHPLTDSLAELARVRGFQRILLRGLESTDVGRLVESAGKLTPSPALVEEIHSRTEGNPFFVTEVTRDLAREAAERGEDFDALKFRIPEGVRQSIGTRLNRLSEECNRVLRTAAVIGREFDFSVLAMTTDDLPESDLLDAVEEALAAGAIREAFRAGERYEFTHALIQETLADELSATRRTRLHARIVDALEQSHEKGGEERISELAFHAAEAELVVGAEKVAHYALMAGDRAFSAYAWAEAARHFETAYGVAQGGVEDAQFAAILSGLGRVWCMLPPKAQDFQDGWDLISRAFSLHLELGDTASAVALAQFPTQFAGIRGTAVVIGRALELVPPDSIDACRLLTRHSIALTDDLGDTAASRVAIERAVALAESLDDPVLKARTLVHRSIHAFSVANYREAAQIGSLAVEAARAADDTYTLVRIGPFVARAMLALGDRKVAEVLISESLAACQRVHDGHYERMNIFARAEALYTKGDFALVSETVLEDSRGRHLIEMIRSETGSETDDRADLIARLQGAAQNPSSVGPIAAASAAIIGHNSRDKEFLGLARSFAESGHPIQSNVPSGRVARQVALGLVAAVESDKKTAAQVYPELRERTGSADPRVFLPIDRILGLLARTLDRPTDAARHFEDALAFCRKAEFRPQLGWTCHDYAEFLLDPGEHANVEKAVSLIDEGLEIARELGMVPLEGRLTILQEMAASAAAPTPAYPDGLTEREVEVLRLLAAGSTNQQIADVLVIAPSTAAKHVANILGKTGSSNRAEAATYANQQGLVETR